MAANAATKSNLVTDEPENVEKLNVFASKTVFGLTREEIEILKTFLMFSVLQLVIEIFLATTLFILKTLDYYPFTKTGTDVVYIYVMYMLLYHCFAHLLSYYSGINSTVPFLVASSVANCIAVLVNVFIIVFFWFLTTNQPAKNHFHSDIILLFLLIIAIITNFIYTYASVIVAVQVRKYGIPMKTALHLFHAFNNHDYTFETEAT